MSLASRGFETQLGPTWPGGVEVSFGQWQKLALARGFMRDHPLPLRLKVAYWLTDVPRPQRGNLVVYPRSHKSSRCRWPSASGA
jgi:hypothetical protein